MSKGRKARAPRKPSPAEIEARDRKIRRRGVLVLAVLVLAAYAPSLGGGFVSDDGRFIVENRPVHELSLVRAVQFFTSPETQATIGHDIYRPLRTLDFAIDWSVAGDAPFWYRLRNLVYHILGAGLLWALFRRLTGEEQPGLASPAFLGAVLFALHPVHVESVAFISSRGDLLCLCFFAGALLMHLRGRTRAAALLLVPALLSKEIAVMFPAAAWLADGFVGRSRPRPWKAYGVYGAVAVAFAGLWFALVAGTGETIQRPGWPGGSWAANLVTVGKSLLLYAKQLVLPIDFVFDYRVPSRPVNGVGDILLALSGLGVFVLAILAGRRARFASLWFLALILPVAGILTPVTNPTTERWMLLPSVGFCLLAGFLLARFRLRYAVLSCFLVLVGSRSLDWRSDEDLLGSAAARASAPIPLNYVAFRQIQRAEESRDREDARAVLRTADEYFRLYREDVVGPMPNTLTLPMLSIRAGAYMLLNQPEDALAAAEEGIELDSDAMKLHDMSTRALRVLGRLDEAIERLYQRGVAAEQAGDRATALAFYSRAWNAHPDRTVNLRSFEAATRLTRELGRVPGR